LRPQSIDVADGEPDSTTAPPSGLAHGLRALRHRNYRRFWFGALISNSGTWLQNLTIPYVLLEITDAAFWVGLAAFAGIFPAMILGPIAGNLADRFDRRIVLVVGQTLAALAAAVLCAAWVAGVRSPVAIVILAAIGGIISGFTMPTWQSFVPTLVKPSDLPSAISLNSLQFNIARAIGPAVGGALIAAFGPAWAFGLNALSFGAVLVALALVDPRSTRQDRNPQPIIEGFIQSLRYIRQQPGIIAGIGLAACVAFLGFPIASFVVVFAKQVYDVEPWALGLMSGLLGIGAILAAPIVAGVFGDLSRAKTVRVALPFYGLMIMVFGTSTSVLQGAVGLVFAGMGFLTIVATSNTAVQIIVADRIRGRVMATRIMTFTGAYPLGALIQTGLADVFGPRPVVTTAGLLLVLAGVAIGIRPRLVSHLDDPPDDT
jgi:MFS family permease